MKCTVPVSLWNVQYAACLANVPSKLPKLIMAPPRNSFAFVQYCYINHASILFLHDSNAPGKPRLRHWPGFTNTFGRIPPDEWSARRRDLHLKTHNTRTRQTYVLHDRIRTSNPRRLMPLTAWPPGSAHAGNRIQYFCITMNDLIVLAYDFWLLSCQEISPMPSCCTAGQLNHRLNYKYIWRITPPSAATLQTKTESLDRQLRWFRNLKIATSSINLSRQAPYLFYITLNATNDQAVTESGHVWWPKTWCYLTLWRLTTHIVVAPHR